MHTITIGNTLIMGLALWGVGHWRSNPYWLYIGLAFIGLAVAQIILDWLGRMWWRSHPESEPIVILGTGYQYGRLEE
jgi:hypothetical protein